MLAPTVPPLRQASIRRTTLQNDWAYNEFATTPVRDARCRTTLVGACQRLAEQAQLSLSRALGPRRKAVSRLIHHPKTTAATLLEGHVRATAVRCQAQPLVLIASDTTSCDFTTHPSVADLGPISDKAHQQGFFVHSALALTPDGVPLGLLAQHTWARDQAPTASAQTKRKRLFADKESHKWLEALRAVETALPASQRALLIQDSEADVFAFFAAERRDGLDLLIRAVQPRCIEVETPAVADVSPAPHTLLKAVAHAPLVATKLVSVAARPDRAAREAHVTVRLLHVRVCAPRNGVDPKAAAVSAWVVSACEETPLPGIKEPIRWILLTTLTHVDAALAVRLVSDYALRWRIERFHFVLKSGCGYEKLQCDTLAALQNMLSLYSVVAWQLLLLTYLAREAPLTAAHVVLSSAEHELLQRHLGRPLHTAQEALLAIARLGGFRGVPSAPWPGVHSLWLGLRKLHDMVAGYLLARQSASP